jgi:hypothetical protein
MMKSLGLVGLGIAIALIVSSLMSSRDAGSIAPPFEPRFADASSAARYDGSGGLTPTAPDTAGLQARVAELEARVLELGATVADLADSRDEPEPEAAPKPESIGVPSTQALNLSATRQRIEAYGVTSQRDREREQLIAAGFTPDRADWIQRRTEELNWQVMQDRYEAQRNGVALPVANPETMLRNELGDAEYERYLMARGRPTQVNVLNVMSASPAARAGLQSGDQIVSYGGRRIFDLREINEMILEGNPGEPVVLEVSRQGQLTQLVIPRGPLGITGSPGAVFTAAGNTLVLQPGF